MKKLFRTKEGLTVKEYSKTGAVLEVKLFDNLEEAEAYRDGLPRQKAKVKKEEKFGKNKDYKEEEEEDDKKEDDKEEKEKKEYNMKTKKKKKN